MQSTPARPDARTTLRRYVADVVSKAPKLSPAQRDVIATALAQTGGGAHR